MLNQDQIAFYRQNGYLVVPEVFSAAKLAALNATTDGFIERARHVTESDGVFDVAADHTFAEPKLRRVKNPTEQHADYDAAMRHPKLIAIVQSLIGDAVRFDHAKLNFKPVGGGAAIEWHQDWAFYPHTNDDMLAVGLYLEDCAEENGPLLVVPETHQGPIFNHHHDGVFSGACHVADVEGVLTKAVPLTGKAGSITIHHVRTLHASSENTGARARRLLLFSYAAVDAWPLVPIVDLATFDSQIVTGEATLAPRQTAVPIRLPLPPRDGADSIYDDQAGISVENKVLQAAT